MDIYKYFIKPILFQFHPDNVHAFITKTGSFLGKFALTRKILEIMYVYKNPMISQEIFGLRFDNPVGIGGGFDKNAELMEVLPSCGFGYIEVGSITAKAYAGNKRPWSVRLPKDRSLIVNYGLKNKGADVLYDVIKNTKRRVPLIINIAKTNDMNIKGDLSIDDYIYTFKKLQDLADIVNINISCPNTGDGVLFCEDMGLLEKLFIALSKINITKPILLKIKPDINDEKLYKICDFAIKYDFIKGFIISNLTKQRELLENTDMKEIEMYSGGISGNPVKKLSDEMIANVYRYTKGKKIIIGLGGIFNAEDAYDKITLGANLVEIVTGLIYGGPSTVRKINQGLVYLLKKDGFSNISEAVGSKNK